MGEKTKGLVEFQRRDAVAQASNGKAVSMKTKHGHASTVRCFHHSVSLHLNKLTENSGSTRNIPLNVIGKSSSDTKIKVLLTFGCTSCYGNDSVLITLTRSMQRACKVSGFSSV